MFSLEKTSGAKHLKGTSEKRMSVTPGGGIFQGDGGAIEGRRESRVESHDALAMCVSRLRGPAGRC